MSATATLAPIAFRFDVERHTYTELATGKLLPHITGMLEHCGYIDDTWYTEESSVRGSDVHGLTASLDLGALDLANLVSDYRPYVLAHDRAMQIMGRPEILAVEEPEVHPRWKFGGRPDRVLRVRQVLTVVDIKTGQKQNGSRYNKRQRSHQVQTALQAILESWKFMLQPHQLQRFALHLKSSGKFELVPHKERSDFDEALEVIHECCAY